jgi:hypothetical protein
LAEELKIIITADDKASDVIKGTNKGLIDLGAIAGGALKVGLAAGAAGVAALGAGLVSSVFAASDAEDAQADLIATLKSTKGVAGMTAEAVNALATQFQNTTRFEDDVTVKGQAMLLTFTNIGKGVFPQATEAMLNMGQKFGSVDAAALQLGKALNDPIEGVTALRRVGVMLTDQQEAQIKSLLGDADALKKLSEEMMKAQDKLPGLTKELDAAKLKYREMAESGTASAEALKDQNNKIAVLVGKVMDAQAAIDLYNKAQTRAGDATLQASNLAAAQKIILGELNTEFGGLAVAAGQTFAGKLDILKNKFGDILETIGGGMLPGLTKLGDGLIKALDDPVVKAAIASISDWLATQLPKAIEMGAGLLDNLQKNGLTNVLRQAQAWVNDPATKAMLQGVGTQVGDGIVSGVKAAATNIPAWTALGTEIGKVAIPIMANVGGAIGVEVYNSIMEKLGIPFRLGIAPAGGAAPVSGFAAGGVVPGPMGAPQLAVVHGGETITPAGGGGGGFTFVYAPMMSLADEREAQTKLAPVLNQWWANAKRMRTA